MSSFSLERTVDIPIDKLWSLLGDFTKSPCPDISVTAAELGDPSAGGIGTIRTITIGRVRVREIIETVDPPHGFTYRILSGAPVKEYVGRALFEDKDGRTRIRWSGDFKPKIPFTGGICCKVAKGAVVQLLDSIEKHHSKP